MTCHLHSLLNGKLADVSFTKFQIVSHSLGTGLLIVMFNPLFKIADAHLPAPVILFTTFGGLRGAVSLILAQMLVTQQDRLQKSGDMLQTAQVTCPSAVGHIGCTCVLQLSATAHSYSRFIQVMRLS